jgi:probable rRNA maturation factor
MAETSLVELVIEDARWEAEDLGAVAEEAALRTLAAAGLEPERYEISLLACDDRRIAALNAEFRGREQPTNVLSWPALGLTPAEPGARPPAPRAGAAAPVFLGDLALAFETCGREAASAGIPLGHHAAHLVVHGCLHLLGYDHATERDAALMESIERNTLASMGIGDPYRN